MYEDPLTPAWFSSIQSPEAKPPKKNFWLLAIIIAACVALVLLLVLAIYLISPKSTCLGKDDYKELTSTTLEEDLDPTGVFYADYISFDNGTSKLDNNTEAGRDGSQTVQKVIDFYQYTKSRSKPIVITIGGTYYSDDSKDTNTEQLATIKSMLLAGGVPNDSVEVIGPVYIEPEETPDDLSDVVIRISSLGSCR